MENIPVENVKATVNDRLLFSGEVRKLLRIGNTALTRYVKEGILHPVYTPGQGKRKFWLSEVRNVPKKGVQA